MSKGTHNPKTCCDAESASLNGCTVGGVACETKAKDRERARINAAKFRAKRKAAREAEVVRENIRR